MTRTKSITLTFDIPEPDADGFCSSHCPLYFDEEHRNYELFQCVIGKAAYWSNQEPGLRPHGKYPWAEEGIINETRRTS